MRKKKVLGMMLSFTLAFGMVLPASMAMPLESRVIVTDSDATKENVTATDSDAAEKRDVVITYEKAEKDHVVVTEPENSITATDSNATEAGQDALATDSNATKVTIEHIETCLEGCTGEGCECMCHQMSLFELIMKCKSLGEIWTIMESASEEEMMCLTDAEWEEIDALVGRIINESETKIETDESDPIVESNVIYPTVTFIDVAPFGKPVEGKAE